MFGVPVLSLDVEVEVHRLAASVDRHREVIRGPQTRIRLERLLGARHVEAVDLLQAVAVLHAQGAEERVGTDAEEAKRLISAMQSLKLEDRILEMQTNKLRELIGRIASEKQKSNQTLFKDPEVGGVFRGNEFPWRQFAQSVTFSDDRPGVLILASEGGGKAVPVGQ